MSRATQQADLGVWGLGVMGANLALNVADHGFTVALWNRTADKTDALLAANRGKPLLGCRAPQDFVAALEPPRRILLMVPAGAPVDESVATLAPLLTGGDILIDGGNSHFMDTRRREAALREKHLAFVGCGISGGEEGARHGPSLMPGGDAPSWARLAPILQAIAARGSGGQPCVAHIGPDGAGHFVKMVHNGIEYGLMQLIAEAYDLLRRGLSLSAPDIGDVFEAWNRGPLESFLVDLAARVLHVRDRKTGRPLVDLVLDAAKQKGTGRWTVQAALTLSVPVPTIAAAVDARTLSSDRAERQAAAGRFPAPPPALPGPAADNVDAWIDAIHDALHASVLCAWAQGLQMVTAANAPYGWAIDPAELARIWTGGCIIRARLLDEVREAARGPERMPNLVLDPRFAGRVQECTPRWRNVVAVAAQHGIPAPALSASLAWFDTLRSAELPTNLTQAQRDAFGAHTFVRRDAPDAGPVHADWTPGAES